MNKCPIITKECLEKECAFWSEDCLIKLALQKYLDPLNLKKTNSYPFSSSTSPTFKPPASTPPTFNPYTDWSGLQGGL